MRRRLRGAARAGGRADARTGGEWQLYPEATHCFDCSTLNNLQKVDFLGNRVVYRYDKRITDEAAQRTFDYLAVQLRKN